MFLCPDLVNIFHKNTFDPYFILRSVVKICLFFMIHNISFSIFLYYKINSEAKSVGIE